MIVGAVSGNYASNMRKPRRPEPNCTAFSISLLQTHGPTWPHLAPLCPDIFGIVLFVEQTKYIILNIEYFRRVVLSKHKDFITLQVRAVGTQMVR